jgi:ElaA protein
LYRYFFGRVKWDMPSAKLSAKLTARLTWRCVPFDKLTLYQLHEIYVARQEVFVVEQDCVYLDADGYDLLALHLIGDVSGKIAAYARLLPPGTKYAGDASIGRVLTRQAFRGKGYGRLLMHEAIAQCETHFPDTTIHISAQHYLLEFYESLGFIACSDVYDEDGIPHIEMKRVPH